MTDYAGADECSDLNVSGANCDGDVGTCFEDSYVPLLSIPKTTQKVVCGAFTPAKWMDTDGVCKMCDDSCLTCEGRASDCTTCRTHAEGWEALVSTSQCRCRDGYYIHARNPKNCSQCHKSCGKCTGWDSTKCSECKSNANLTILDTRKGTGKCEAGDGYYMDTDGITKPCHHSCLTCNGPAFDNCIECHSSATQLVNSCICDRLQYMKNRQC